MNAALYRHSLAQLGLSQAAAAKLLGVSLRTSQAYALGESKVPKTVGLILKYLQFWKVLDMPGEEPFRDSIEGLVKKLIAAHGLATRGEVERYVLNLSDR
jgi:transcriptional regulator with XRE-family HTH domain